MKKNEFFAGAAIGAIIGSVVGIFLAPKSGKETLQNVKKTANDLSKKIMAELSKLEKISKKEYHAIVDKTVQKLQQEKKWTDKKVKEIESDLKKKWSLIEKELNKHTNTNCTKKSAKKK